MLEYFAYKKIKAHQEKKDAVKAQESGPSLDTVESDRIVSGGLSESKGKGAVKESDAISTSDEIFLERNLANTSSLEAPVTLRQRIASVTQQWQGLRLRGHGTETTGPSSAVLQGQSRPVDVGKEAASLDEPLEDEESQRTQLQKLLDAFNMNMSSTGAAGSSSDSATPKTLTERMSDTLKVSTFNDKTRELMSEFVQILKDIQNGVPLAGQDLIAYFDKHAGDLKTVNDNMPSFIKSLVLKLLPLSAIPSIEELSKPGALMGLIKGVLQVLKSRFPAFVGGSVLTVMAVVVVMLGLFYAFKRGREEREALETSPFSQASSPGVPGSDRGRQVEISVDGVRYVTILDEDGMRIPCPEDDRRVYWDATKQS